MANFWQRTCEVLVDFFRTLSFIKAGRFFLVVFLLTFPFQIRTLLYSLNVFQSGEFDFYTSFFLYFSDICFFAAFLFWAISLFKKQSEFYLGDEMLSFMFLALLLIMIGTSFFVAQPVLHFFMTFRFVELFLLYLMIVNKVLAQRQIIFCLLGGFCFQALLAIYQYLTQSSLGLTFLGEPQANSLTLGVAKIDLGSQKILRAFGTLPQANVLGGLIVICIIYAFALLKKYRRFVISAVCLLALGLLFTFSRSAFFALIAAFLLYISIQNSKIGIKYILLAAAILFFLIVIFNLQNIVFNRLLFEDTASTQERALYLKSGINMLIAQPLGVGLGGFTLQLQNFTTTKLAPWLFQPVHNIFLLMADEIGLVGGILFAAIFVYIFYKLLSHMRRQKTAENKFAVGLLLAVISAITVIGFFDHYFLTIYAGQVMLFIYFGFVGSLLSNERLPAKNS